MAENDVRLLPCPFCGHSACGPHNVPARVWADNPPMRSEWIHCPGCGAQMERADGMKDVVVKVWNRRAPDAAADRDRQFAEAVRGEYDLFKSGVSLDTAPRSMLRELYLNIDAEHLRIYDRPCTATPDGEKEK